jgi:hypothetical protein
VPEAVSAEIVSERLPVLPSVIVCEPLLPTGTLPKLTLVGFAVSEDWTPVPVIPIVVGDEAALLVINMLPAGLPVAPGANFAVIVEVPPAAIEIGSVNPLAEYPVPEAVTAEMVRVAFPGLLNVIVCEELPPTATFPNVTLAGLAVIWGADTTPVPVSVIVAGEFVALLVTVTVPDPLTPDVGAYFAATVATCPGVKVIGTVTPDSENPVPPAMI